MRKVERTLQRLEGSRHDLLPDSHYTGVGDNPSSQRASLGAYPRPVVMANDVLNWASNRTGITEVLS